MKKLAVALIASLALIGAAFAQTPCEGPDCEKKCTQNCPVVDI